MSLVDMLQQLPSTTGHIVYALDALQPCMLSQSRLANHFNPIHVHPLLLHETRAAAVPCRKATVLKPSALKLNICTVIASTLRVGHVG